MLNLNELSVFLAVAKYGTFSEAGRQLHLSQPAISQTIDNLEKRYGIKLFLRQGRGVCLTEAGQMLRPLSSELLASARHVDESMASLQGAVVGELDIDCSTASGKYLLPGLAARFRRQFPQVRINVHVTGRETAFRKLLAGETSFIVTSKVVEHSELEYQAFFEEELILIAAPDHPWARSSRVVPADLLGEPLISREEAAGTYRTSMEGLRRFDILPDMLTVVMVSGNAEAVVVAVEEGIGVAFVSSLSAAHSLELGRVVNINVNGLTLKREIYMAHNHRYTPTRAQVEFWSFVETQSPEIN